MMKSRVQDAKNRHKNGYNCAQAVAFTYCDLLGMDKKTAFRAVEAYGLGISKKYATCGSVCAMIMLAGLKNSDANLQAPASKFATFELGGKMMDKFAEWNSSYQCADLRGTDGKTDRLRSCRGCVADCARLVEDFLFPGQFEKYEERSPEEE